MLDLNTGVYKDNKILRITIFSYVIHNGEIENELNQKSIKHRGRMHEFTFLQHSMLIIPVKCIDAIMSA